MTRIVLAIALFLTGSGISVISPTAAYAHDDPRLATYNAPHREGLADRRYDLRRLDSRGVGIVALQEVTDGDPARIKPAGWRHYRPWQARSAAVVWDPADWRLISQGWKRISTESSPSSSRFRALVWVYVADRHTGERLRFASVHLVAWPYKTDARAAEHRHQLRQVARWIEGGSHRRVGGDLNSRPDHARMAPLDRVANHHRPVVGTYKGRVPLDHFWTPHGEPVVNRVYAMPTRGSDHDALVGRLR